MCRGMASTVLEREDVKMNKVGTGLTLDLQEDMHQIHKYNMRSQVSVKGPQESLRGAYLR